MSRLAEFVNGKSDTAVSALLPSIQSVNSIPCFPKAIFTSSQEKKRKDKEKEKERKQEGINVKKIKKEKKFGYDANNRSVYLYQRK